MSYARPLKDIDGHRLPITAAKGRVPGHDITADLSDTVIKLLLPYV
jgi:hypothetical protein